MHHHGNAKTCCEGLVTQSRLVAAPPRAPGPIISCHISCQIYHCGQNCHCIANSVTIILIVTGIVLTVLISLFFPVDNNLIQLEVVAIKVFRIVLIVDLT